MGRGKQDGGLGQNRLCLTVAGGQLWQHDSAYTYIHRVYSISLRFVRAWLNKMKLSLCVLCVCVCMCVGVRGNVG